MPQLIFFDLDGTLTDPRVGITRSIQHALHKFGIEPPSCEKLTKYIGPPLIDSFAEIVGDARATKALEYYRERFSEFGWKENEVYPGIRDTLGKLRNADFRLCVATSKPEIFARRIVEHFEIDQYFDAIYGAELDGTRSDKSELLRFALTETAPSGAAAMIGDRKHDVIGAIANGMQAIGVTWGYGSREELQAAGATILVDTPEALLAANFE